VSNILDRLNACRESGVIDPALLPEAVAAIGELVKRQNVLEELLIMIVRTGWPWDEEGEPNEIFRTCKDGYAAAMIEAKKLLGLDHLSRITRMEPRT
jgi:hypothetical protein